MLMGVRVTILLPVLHAFGVMLLVVYRSSNGGWTVELQL